MCDRDSMSWEFDGALPWRIVWDVNPDDIPGRLLHRFTATTQYLVPFIDVRLQVGDAVEHRATWIAGDEPVVLLLDGAPDHELPEWATVTWNRPDVPERQGYRTRIRDMRYSEYWRHQPGTDAH